MSTRRRVNGYEVPYPKDDQGRNLCRGCGVVVKRPRIHWCSDACVEAHKLRTDPSYVRQKVWERDKGVCAMCGGECDLSNMRTLCICCHRRVTRELASRRARAKLPNPQLDLLKEIA